MRRVDDHAASVKVVFAVPLVGIPEMMPPVMMMPPAMMFGGVGGAYHNSFSGLRFNGGIPAPRPRQHDGAEQHSGHRRLNDGARRERNDTVLTHNKHYISQHNIKKTHNFLLIKRTHIYFFNFPKPRSTRLRTPTLPLRTLALSSLRCRNACSTLSKPPS